MFRPSAGWMGSTARDSRFFKPPDFLIPRVFLWATAVISLCPMTVQDLDATALAIGESVCELFCSYEQTDRINGPMPLGFEL